MRRPSHTATCALFQQRRFQWVRVSLASLLVLVYLQIFLFMEDDMSYATVVATNTAGEEQWNATVTKLEEQREAKRLRQSEKAKRADSSSSVTDDDDDDDGRNGDDVSLWRFLLLYMIIRLWLQGQGRNNSVGPQSRQARRTTRLSQLARQERFRLWADRLNQQRQQHGQQPLSMESLQLVLRERELSNGDDYDALLRFNEESGPATQALVEEAGATAAEIHRLPFRTVAQNDDLLREGGSACSICLESFQVGEYVRTIPCFHTFHRHCIDRWLTEKAICPVCKHPALG